MSALSVAPEVTRQRFDTVIRVIEEHDCGEHFPKRWCLRFVLDPRTSPAASRTRPARGARADARLHTRLKSGSLLWPAQSARPVGYPVLAEDIACDVVIVGAGIVGALVADRLAARNLSVMLVDKGDIGAGSTSASTALLMYQLDVGLCELSEKIGEKKALRAYRISRRSLADLTTLIRELGVPCGFRAKKALYVASTEADATALQAEYRLLRRHRFDVNFLDAAALRQRFAIDRKAAIVVHQAAEVDPYRLTRALVRRARAGSVRIHESTEIATVVSSARKKILTTAAGNTITARHVVLSTGYESQRYLAKKVVDLKSSYVVASAPTPALRRHWLKDYLVWETARPYLYIRSTADHRVIVGGADEGIVAARERDALIAGKARSLRRKFAGLIGWEPPDAAYRWAGTFGETDDGLGYIGCAPELKRVHFALGFGGNGITFGMTAATMISRRILKQKTPDLSLFAFGRSG